MTTYGIGEVIYPRQFDEPACLDCPHSPRVHRYVVVSDTKMAANGCDGAGPGQPCPCRRYHAAEAVPGVQNAIPTREEAWQKYASDALKILPPSEAETKRCGQALCRAPVWFGLTRANKKRCPFDIRPDGSRTGTSHWRTCTDRPVREPRSKRA